MKSKNILITGASGLIGKELTALLQTKDYVVSHLGRKNNNKNIPSFVWDINKQHVDPKAMQSSSVVVHLAGAGVAEKRWTTERKKEILESRTLSTRLLCNSLKEGNHAVDTVVCASAIGFYGFHDESNALHEDDKPGFDFLADVVKQWEKEADAIATLGIRLVKIRIGVVLSKDGGALKEMAKPVKFFVGSPLGSGEQYISWIHINDLCAIFLKAIEDNSMHGAYNAVAPNPVTNRTLTQYIATTLHRPLLLPAVPGFALKLILGEMADLVLRGSNVSAQRILNTGFTFQYTNAEEAVKNLLKPY